MENKEFAYKKNRAEGAAEETDVTVKGRILRAAKGTTLGELLKKEGLAMPCAGMGRCGKCRVRAEGRLSEPDAVEQQKLSAKELSGNIRLACRTVILGPCQVEWETERDMEIRLGDRASFGGGEPLFDRLGAAVDVGTTTLAAQLYGENGLLAQTGLENPQKAYGADVISRVERSLAGEGEALKKAVCGGIGTLLRELAAHAGVSAEQIDTLVITGNTSMLYLLTGRSPECLSHAPFQADWLAGEWTDGKALGLPCPDARVYFPPCISAFVGADITCAMLHTGLGESAEPELLADIGTNGEIVLNQGRELFCCSTAAGPAFEGAGLSCGMPGKEGAIFRVEWKDGHLESSVIGGGPAKGICGSGVVDAVSCLLQSGRLDENRFSGRGCGAGGGSGASSGGHPEDPARQGSHFRRNPDHAAPGGSACGEAGKSAGGRRLREQPEYEKCHFHRPSARHGERAGCDLRKCGAERSGGSASGRQQAECSGGTCPPDRYGGACRG